MSPAAVAAQARKARRAPPASTPARAAVLLALALAAGCATGGAPPPAPGPPPAPKSLFEANTPLRLTLEAPWSKVVADRAPDSERTAFPGVLRYDGPEGQVQLDVEVRTRGRARLDKKVCSFPPLRLEFDKQQAKGSVFQGQKKLKLVTHCRSTPAHEQVALQEYLVYRAYNLLTEHSFRVRLAYIRYVEGGGGEVAARYAFFIEPAEDVAKRAGLELVEENEVDPARMDSKVAAQVELFQFMIGNTDWSLRKGTAGEPCCHNALHLAGKSGPTTPAPYDFDYAGVVDAPYALPDERLGIDRVTQRVYMGYCRPAADLDRALAALSANREAIAALVRSEPALLAEQRARALAYYDGFFAIAADPARRKAAIDDRCRAPRRSPD